MGVSTDAILAFGFDLGEELPESLVGEDGDSGGFEFEEWLKTKAGIVYPEGHAGIKSPAYTAYYEAGKALVEACPVDLITHCSYDYPMYFLAVRGTEVKAWRGHPKTVTTGPIKQSQLNAMRKFCDDNGIPWQEPQWHIFSLWG